MLSRNFDKTFGGTLVQIQAQPAIMPPDGAGVKCRSAEGPETQLSLLSWNLLATPYIRDPGESDSEGLIRAQKQISYASAHQADVIGLQEFFHLSPKFVALWREFAAVNGYVMHVCPRVNGKADGCCMLVRAGLCAAPPTFTTFTFDDWGHRILQSCTLQLASMQHPLVLMHTHLTFPHDNEWDPVMRRHQARKAAELVRQQQGATVVFGDLNTADEEDEALRVLTTLGELALLPPSADGNRWVSHVAHTGAHMAADLVLTRACQVARWHLGGSHEELVRGALPSDHRPLHAILQLMPGGASEEQRTVF